MKKISKKRLVIALTVVMLLAASVFAVSAVEADKIYCSKCTLQVEAVLGTVHAPQCEAEGYTELLCPICSAIIGRTDVIEETGHSYVDDYELAESGDYYKLYDDCANCVHRQLHIEYDGEGNPLPADKYYKVNFFNNFATDETDASIAYAKIVTSYKTEAFTSIYVKAGETTQCKEGTPYRGADKTFGAYKFMGWASESEIIEALGAEAFDAGLVKALDARTYYENYTYVDGVITYTDIEKYEKLMELAEVTFTVPDGVTVEGEELKADYDLYAIFKADTGKTHTVRFYNYNGYLLSADSTVIHGGEAECSVTPIRPSNIEYNYSFYGWSYDGKKIMSVNKIYGDVDVVALYSHYLNTYVFKYFDNEGNPIVYNNGSTIQMQDTVTVAGFDYNINGVTCTRQNPINGRTITPENGFEQVASYSDKRYNYTFTGKWCIQGRDNKVIDLNNVQLPSDVLNYEQTGGYIALVPQFAKVERIYKLPVYVSYSDDGNWHPENISLQLTNSNGDLIGATTLTSANLVGNDVYGVTFDVKYSQKYFVAASSVGFSGSGSTTFADSLDTPSGIAIRLVYNINEQCGCICHTIFKPIWVRVLNLLNTLFGLEHVCCDDMYANIGDSLNYGPNAKA